MIEQIYTPISFLKKVFRQGERSLSRQEVSHRLQAHYVSGSEEAENLIQAALSQPNSPFREGNSKAIIQFNQGTPALATHVFRVLREAGIPMTEDQLLRKLRGLNLVSWSFPFERLGLQGDHRFIQLTDQRWLLNEWEIVNNQVYDYLSMHGTTELPNQDIPFLLQMKMGLAMKKSIFLPEFDRRFKVDESRLYILTNQANEQDVSLTDQMEESHAIEENLLKEMETKTMMEVAATMSQETLEVVAEREETTTVVDEVIQDLIRAHYKLEQRSNEMKEEVVNYFSSNNLDAIRGLMNEKEKNEKILLKLKEIVNELS